MFFMLCLYTALKKPAITQKHDEAPGVALGAGAETGVGAADGLRGQGLALDQPKLQQERAEGRGPPGAMKQADKPIVFEEDSKAGIKADELGEQQKQLQGTVFISLYWYLSLLLYNLSKALKSLSQSYMTSHFLVVSSW